MRQSNLTAGRATSCDLVPQGVVHGHIANGVRFNRQDEHHKDDEDRNPEAVEVGLGLVLLGVFHDFQYSA